MIIIGTEYIQKIKSAEIFYTRKIIHILTGILITLALFLMESYLPILLLAFVTIAVNYFAIKKNILKSIHGSSLSYGTVYYPLSVLFLMIFWLPDQKLILIVSILVMSVSDALAAIFGNYFGKKHFVFIRDRKSIIGSTAMFVSAAIIVFISLQGLNLPIHKILITTIAVGIIATVAELLSSNGSDNLTVPAFTSLFFYAFINPADNEQFYSLITGLILSAIIAIMSYRVKFLSRSGAGATFILGSVVFGLGGMMFTIPILTFFIISSLLSKVGKSNKQSYDSKFEKSGVRDYAQVIANGGLPGIIIIIQYFLPGNNLFIFYLTALAAANADTWATELGFFAKRGPWLITTFENTFKGRSGAISIIGSLASLAGSAVIAITGFIVDFNSYSFTLFMLVTISGFSASIFDSLLGATVQRQFTCDICNDITEKKLHCNTPTKHLKGAMIINNDVVNTLSILLSLIVLRIFY